MAFFCNAGSVTVYSKRKPQPVHKVGAFLYDLRHKYSSSKREQVNTWYLLGALAHLKAPINTKGYDCDQIITF